MIKKLRWKFVLVTTAFSMAILCVVFFSSFHTTKNAIEKESEETLSMIADMKQIQVAGLPYFQSNDIRVPFFLVDITRDGVIVSVRSNYFSTDAEDFEMDTQWLINIVQDALNQEDSTGIMKTDQLRFYRKVRLDGWRVVFMDMTMEHNVINNLLQNMLFLILGSFLGIFVLSLGLAYWITKPVERAWNQQRQFVADASHELKTPLTVILSNTDMLLSHEIQSDGNTQKRLENIQAESLRMKGLVEDMLYLARSDAEKKPKQLERVSISDAVMDSVLLFEALAFEKQKELDYKIEENIFVMGSMNMLKQLVEILLDNAMKYSNQGGKIRIELEKNTARSVRLMVSNSGDTMTEEQCRRIFERFYRTDPAREHNGGYGLGLSIAASLVKELEGKIWAESKNGLNSFYVQLPFVKSAQEKSK